MIHLQEPLSHLNNYFPLPYSYVCRSRQVKACKVFLFVCLFFFGYAGSWLHHAFSSCGAWGLLFIGVCGLFTAVASPVEEQRLQALGLQQLPHRLSNCSLWAPECCLSSCGSGPQLLHSMRNLPGSGIEPMSSALADRFLTTEPPRKPQNLI